MRVVLASGGWPGPRAWSSVFEKSMWNMKTASVLVIAVSKAEYTCVVFLF